jgi:hypothetical protein
LHEFGQVTGYLSYGCGQKQLFEQALTPRLPAAVTREVPGGGGVPLETTSTQGNFFCPTYGNLNLPSPKNLLQQYFHPKPGPS